MAADLQKFLFKSKFLRKLSRLVILYVLNVLICNVVVLSITCDLNNGTSYICDQGDCGDHNVCKCFSGWTGNQCQFCSGRLRITERSGFIFDGSGNYSENNECTWLIDPQLLSQNSVLRLYLDHFSTECSWDHLYIYDGSSIYDPLLAVYSGVIVKENTSINRVPEVVATSGKALLYFYSDAAYNLTGFKISFKLNGCPRNVHYEECSGHGICVNGICNCDTNWMQEDCSVPICSHNCFGNGKCNEEKKSCDCFDGFTGYDCSQKIDQGWWNETISEFSSEFARASHCSVLITNAVWIIGGYSFHDINFVLRKSLKDGMVTKIKPKSKLIPSLRNGHTCIVFNDKIYMYGGTILNSGKESNELWEFNPISEVWSLIAYSPVKRIKRNAVKNFNSRTRMRNSKLRHNSGRYLRNKRDNKLQKSDKLRRNSHGKSVNKLGKSVLVDQSVQEKHKKDSAVAIADKNTKKGIISNTCLQPSPKGYCSPVAVVGHASVVFKDSMLVFFGYSSIYDSINIVQEFNFELRKWRVVETTGAIVAGTVGHTAVSDPESESVFIHGGLETYSFHKVLNRLIVYQPANEKWIIKRPSPLPRFFHSSVLSSGLILVFGGNTHNDTAVSRGTQCYSNDFHAYDIHCDKWLKLKGPPDRGTAISRYGHSVISNEQKMVILGGFNGQMLSNSWTYTFGNCDWLKKKKDCLAAYPGRKCVWNRILERCETFSQATNKENIHSNCPVVETKTGEEAESVCQLQSSCHSCLYNSYGCVWCKGKCTTEKCSIFSKSITKAEDCEDRTRWWCKSLRSCSLCSSYQVFCSWVNKECISNNTVFVPSLSEPKSAPESGLIGSDSDSLSVLWNNFKGHCSIPCFERRSCMNCTMVGCLWCFNLGRCAESNSYLISFPYGQCREWTTNMKKCPRNEKMSLSKCVRHNTVERCHRDISCGWCDDGSGTGTGFCLEGGQSGPISVTDPNSSTKSCPIDQWYFTKRPLCNCNGHSICVNASVCVKPCGNNTKGRNCERCNDSFFGSSINGGSCKPCQCNDHALSCQHDTGKCNCYTKGIIGHHCERCDTQNSYFGEPLKGSCFYDLQIDYQFTFNLSKHEDGHIRKINFYNVPKKPDVDTDFDILCSKPARIKISAKFAGSSETWILQNYTGTLVKRRFSASDFVFGPSANNTTFHVYVSEFRPPIEIIISFSQHPKLDLIQFFSIFSLCFMVLLFFAFVMWKIKQRYDIHARRQRLMIEVEAMASRPFCSVYLQLRPGYTSEKPKTEPSSEPPVKGSPGSIPSSPKKDVIASNSSKNAVVTPSNDIRFEPIAKPVESCFNIKKKRKKVKKAEISESSKNISDSNPTVSSTDGVVDCNGACAWAEIDPVEVVSQLQPPKKLKTSNSSTPIALEPCQNNRAAILSLFVELPTGGTRYTAPGHPGGLAVASALVSLGPPPLSCSEASFFPKEVVKNNDKKVSIVRIRDIPSNSANN